MQSRPQQAHHRNSQGNEERVAERPVQARGSPEVRRGHDIPEEVGGCQAE